MAWIVLVISGLFEAVWATALGKSDGFSKMSPTIVFVLGLIVSMAGLAYAMRTLPIGTSYAIWVGIGAALLPILEKLLPRLQAMGNFVRENTGLIVTIGVVVGTLAASILALNAGKHVACTVPMATSIEDCRRVVQAQIGRAHV